MAGAVAAAFAAEELALLRGELDKCVYVLVIDFLNLVAAESALCLLDNAGFLAATNHFAFGHISHDIYPLDLPDNFFKKFLLLSQRSERNVLSAG